MRVRRLNGAAVRNNAELVSFSGSPSSKRYLGNVAIAYSGFTMFEGVMWRDWTQRHYAMEHSLGNICPTIRANRRILHTRSTNSQNTEGYQNPVIAAIWSKCYDISVLSHYNTTSHICVVSLFFFFFFNCDHTVVYLWLAPTTVAVVTHHY